MKIRNFKKSTKALSPVVASIILIAVTVAVSIAVAVWMGALSQGFMKTEQLTITSVNINTGANTATIGVSDTGTTSVSISQVWVGNIQIAAGSLTWTGNTTANTFASNAQGTIAIAQTFTSGNNYVFKLLTSKGTTFTYTQGAP